MGIGINLVEPSLIYKALTGEKKQAILPYTEPLRKYMARVESGELIDCDVWYDQNDDYGYRLFYTYIDRLELVFTRNLTEADAYAEGFDSLSKLYIELEKYNHTEFMEKPYVRVVWRSPKIIPRRLAETKIDWEPLEKLYTINPFILSRKYRHCFYNCRYCYMTFFYKRFYNRFIEGLDFSRLYNIRTAHDNIFVNSTTDLFHPRILSVLIRFIIEEVHRNNINRCKVFYLTKNPARYAEFLPYFDPELDFLGATIEADSYEPQFVKFTQKYVYNSFITSAPAPKDRITACIELNYPKKFVSVEPVMKFDKSFARSLIDIKPVKVIIGANTSTYRLIEPSEDNIRDLIENLSTHGIKVRKKENLSKLVKEIPDNHTLLEFMNFGENLEIKYRTSSRREIHDMPEK